LHRTSPRSCSPAWREEEEDMTKKTSQETSPEAPQKPSAQSKKAKKHACGVLILVLEPKIKPSTIKKFGKSGLTNDEAQFVFGESLHPKSKRIGECPHALLHATWTDPEGTSPYSRGRAEAIPRDILDEFAARGYLANLPLEAPRKPPKEYKR